MLGTCWGVATKSLFTKALSCHAKDDVGAALGVLDVMNSGIGVVSPLLGGLLLVRYSSR